MHALHVCALKKDRPACSHTRVSLAAAITCCASRCCCRSNAFYRTRALRASLHSDTHAAMAPCAYRSIVHARFAFCVRHLQVLTCLRLLTTLFTKHLSQECLIRWHFRCSLPLCVCLVILVRSYCILAIGLPNFLRAGNRCNRARPLSFSQLNTHIRSSSRLRVRT